MKFERAEFQPYISLQVAPIPQSRVAKHDRDDNEFETAARKAAEHPRDELACLLSLLQEPCWHAGSWSDEQGGWHDSRTSKFLSFGEGFQLIDSRIESLGLDATLVHAYTKSRSSLAEYQKFWALNFEDRMERFRK